MYFKWNLFRRHIKNWVYVAKNGFKWLLFCMGKTHKYSCVCPSIHSTYVHQHFVSVRFDNLSIYKQISFKFCICISTNNVSLGIGKGQISIIYHRVVSVFKKWFLASSSFTIWSIMMKLHKSDRSNKSSRLA